MVVVLLDFDVMVLILVFFWELDVVLLLLEVCKVLLFEVDDLFILDVFDVELELVFVNFVIRILWIGWGILDFLYFGLLFVNKIILKKKYVFVIMFFVFGNICNFVVDLGCF